MSQRRREKKKAFNVNAMIGSLSDQLPMYTLLITEGMLHRGRLPPLQQLEPAMVKPNNASL